METKFETRMIYEIYYAILNEIHLAINECLKKGITPKEVWLGPKEREIFAIKWMSEKIDLSKYLPNHFPFDESVESVKEKLKGSQIFGLNIRFAEEDGVRVGVSFEG